jgi:hypothetical protein
VKLAPISEVHADVQAPRATLDDIASRPVDRIACLRDIVGNDTNPHECIALLREVQALCVAGNHDPPSADRLRQRLFVPTPLRGAIESGLRSVRRGHTVHS